MVTLNRMKFKLNCLSVRVHKPMHPPGRGAAGFGALCGAHYVSAAAACFEREWFRGSHHRQHKVICNANKALS